MVRTDVLVIAVLACVCAVSCLPRPRAGNKDIHIKRVKRDDGSQYLDVRDPTSEPSLKAPGMIDDVLMSGALAESVIPSSDDATIKISSNEFGGGSALNDSETNNGMNDGSYEMQQEENDLGDIIANLPMADDSEDDDVDLTLYPQGWSDQTADDGEDGQVYERRKRNVVAAMNLAQQQHHAQQKSKHSASVARNKLKKARSPNQIVPAAMKNRTKRGVSAHSQQQQQPTMTDEDLLNLILLADQLQSRKQQQYREQYSHPRRPLISDEDPLLTAALLAAQAEDEEGMYGGRGQEEDDELYMPMSRARSHLNPIYSPKGYSDAYGPLEFPDNGYRRSEYRQAYLPGQKRSKNQDHDKLYAIAQMLGKTHDQPKSAYRRQRA